MPGIHIARRAQPSGSVPYDALILAESALTHYYPLDEAAGSTSVTDRKGSINSEAVSGVTFGTAGGCVDGSTCASGFNRGAQFIRFPTTSPWPLSGDMTLELGLFIGSVNGSFQRILCDDNGPSAQLMIEFSTNDLLFYNAPSLVDAPTGAWKHIAITVSGTTVKYYFNGSLVATKVVDNITTNVQYPASGRKIYIGAPDNSWFGGKIQKVAFYNDDLSAASILAHSNAYFGT